MRLSLLACFTAVTTLAFAAGCGDAANDNTTSGSGGAGAGGGSAGAGGTGGETEAPDYEAAFPQDRVPRLDITISPENWKLMVDDMTELLGEFGAGMGGGMMPPGGGFSPPQELFDACNELVIGDACSADLNGQMMAGTCADFMGQGVFCQPSMGPGGMPPGGGGGGVDLIQGTPIYVECDIATEDRSWKHVGIRFKGNSSLAMPWMQGTWKLPLRLGFDKYEDAYPETQNQRFYGFKSLSLSNASMDDSLMRDKIGTEVFVKAGIPAPATAWYRVFIDHGEGSTYFGLYTGIELPTDSSFLKGHFGDNDGNLYKPDGTGAQWATYDEATLGKENNEDAADFSDAKALYDALHADRTDAAAWRAGLEAKLDVDGFLHWLALNTAIQDWDQYGRMPHNYYLYADPGQNGRFSWIPWDHTFAFNPQQAGSLSLDEVTADWPLIRFLLDDPVYEEVYRGYLKSAVEKEYEPIAAEARFTAGHALIAPYVTGAEGEKPGYTFLTSSASFDDSLPALIAHAKQRSTDVSTFLGP